MGENECDRRWKVDVFGTAHQLDRLDVRAVGAVWLSVIAVLTRSD